MGRALCGRLHSVRGRCISIRIGKACRLGWASTGRTFLLWRSGQLPARLTAEQAAWMLGCQVHDMPILVASRLPKPLGNPPPNGIKFFATVNLVEHSKDRSWLTRMTVAITNHWKGQNGKQRRAARCDGASQLVRLPETAEV